MMLTNKTPKTPAPILNRAPIIDTRVNANPQLANIANKVNSSNESIRGNTNNSAVARANITANNLKGAELNNNVLANKQNQERVLQTQQNQVMAANSASNNALNNEYQKDVYENTIKRNLSYSKNISNAVEDYTAAKKSANQFDNEDDLIALGLANDPNGEKARSYARIGGTLNKKNRAQLAKHYNQKNKDNNNG